MTVEYRKMSLQEFLTALAEPTPTPGGGAAAALAGALGAALGAMVLRIASRKAPRDLGSHIERLRLLQEELIALAEEDAAAYEAVMAARKLPAGSPEEKAMRRARIQEALRGAAQVPLRTAALALELLELLGEVQDTVGAGLLSDLLVATRLASASLHGALNNVDVNCSLIKDAEFLRFAARKRRELLYRGTEISGGILAREEEIKNWLGEEDSNLH